MLHRMVFPLRALYSLVRVSLWKRSVGSRNITSVVLLEHLGDIVACEPVSRFLKKTDPGHLLVWFVRKPYLELLESNPSVDRPFVIGCLTEWFWIRRFLNFDKIFELHPEGRVCPWCNIPLRKRSGDRTIDGENYYNHGSLLSAFAKGSGLPDIPLGPSVNIGKEVAEKVDSIGLPEKFIAFNAQSNEPCRDWPQEKWVELIEGLGQEWPWGFVEVGLKSSLPRKPRVDYRDLCGRLSILESAEVIRRSSLYVGIDSGPAHLANAVGARAVILLGQYRAFTSYLPYSGRYSRGEDVRILFSRKEAGAVPVSEVRSAVLSMIPKNSGDTALGNQLRKHSK